MGRPRKERPNFVSVDILRLRQIKMTMSNEEFGAWCSKALDDMSLDCVGNDVDPIVLECYEHAKGRLSLRHEQNTKFRESRKNNSNSSVSTEVLDAVKRDDQLIYGHFENVFLSQAEFNELANMMGNINELHDVIENFSAALSDGTRHSRNHFATLSYWINYRRKMGEKEGTSVRSGGCSFEQHNLRALEKANRQVEEMVRKGLIK